MIPNERGMGRAKEFSSPLTLSRGKGLPLTSCHQCDVCTHRNYNKSQMKEMAGWTKTIADAKARGAKILAEFLGYALSSDSKDMVKPDVEDPKTAMQMALDDAGLAASEVSYLNAHGTATTLDDANVKLAEIFSGAMPFVLATLTLVLVLILFPALALVFL